MENAEFKFATKSAFSDGDEALVMMECCLILLLLCAARKRVGDDEDDKEEEEMGLVLMRDLSARSRTLKESKVCVFF
jgi:hypothetical protein